MRLESLERRELLAADVVISEFLASNESILRDNDRDSSDWIEIFNRGDEPVNLQGWSLTDDADELDKWRFPDTTLEPGEFQVIFASGKNRQDDDGQLHTNFRLSASGEYLALVPPDSGPIVEFAPAYPSQLTDISFGRTMSEHKLISASSPTQWWVPSDDDLGFGWTHAEFDATGWTTGSAAIGFSSGGLFQSHFTTDVSASMHDRNASVYVRIPFEVESVADITELTARFKFDDGYIAYLNGQLVDLQNSPFFSSFDATAVTDRPDDAALAIVEVDYTDHLEKLRPGKNVLAIQGLNSVASDADFLLSVELLTSRVDVGTDDGFFTNPTPHEINAASFQLGPRIGEVQHEPHEPSVDDDWLIAARVTETLNPIDRVSLKYRVMYEEEQSIDMNDHGTDGDAVAGDGLFSARIPAGVAAPGEMLRYAIVATDRDDHSFRQPRLIDTTGTDQSPAYYGTVITAPELDHDVAPVFHWFTEDVAASRTRSGARASVYYAGEFYDNIKVRARGGATNGASQKFNFGDDQKFFVNEKLGRVAEINMNAQGSDSSYLRQPLAFRSYTWAGNPSSESFLMQMRLNGEHQRIGVFIEQPDEDLLKRHGLDPEGALYKFVQRTNLDPVFADTLTGIEKKTRLDEGRDDVQQVVDGLTRDTAEERARAVFDQFDVAAVLNYMAVRSVTLDADDVRKNFYLYRDTNGTQQWSILPWDKDWTFGIRGDGGQFLDHPFFGDEARRKDNALQWNRLYDAVTNDATLREMYLRRLRSVMDLLLQPPGTTENDAFYEQQVRNDLERYRSILPNSAISQAEGPLTRYFAERRPTLYRDHSIDLLPESDLRVIIPEFIDNVRYLVPTNDDLGLTWTDVTPPANIEQWQTGQTGFGFHERFDELVRTRVVPQEVCEECTSIFLRIPFNVDDASAIETLSLQMKFDDGFVAYINGQEVARDRFRDEPSYTARGRSRSNDLVLQFKNFVLTNPSAYLRDGENVLAIHAVNNSSRGTDMLMMPVLVEGNAGDPNAVGIPHQQTENPPLTFGQLDHNPSSGNQDEEYIEVRNPLGTAVDISGWQLQGGVEHEFRAGTVIPAFGSMYVSPHVPSFLGRQVGPRGNQGLFVQGNYRGHLSNLGESVELVAADGASIDRFTTPYEPSEVQQHLRISEVHYHPAGEDEATEFIELANTSSQRALDISNVSLTVGDSTFHIPDGTLLAARGHVVIAADPNALRSAHPGLSAEQVLGPSALQLDNGGDEVVLDDAMGGTVVTVRYNDNRLWPRRADGAGASLELTQLSMPPSLASKPYAWQGSSTWGGSPGRLNASKSGVEVSEVLSSPINGIDAIELHNRSGATVDLTGAYLSDDADELMKFAIPNGTTIAPGATLVVTEEQFNSSAEPRGFALNGTQGDSVWLTAVGASGNVETFIDDVHFGGSVAGESWGPSPFVHGSLVPMANSSLGASTVIPRVGPLLISEVNYHPGEPSESAVAMDATLKREDLEFVEIHNPTERSIALDGWRLRGGADFDFPAGSSIAPGATLVVTRLAADDDVGTEAFRIHYSLDASTMLLGGFDGQLSDSYDRVALQRPIARDQNVGYATEDEVIYDDQSPWPRSADGLGNSLERIGRIAPGHAAASWRAVAPNPSVVELQPADLNADGVIDSRDIDRLCHAVRNQNDVLDVNRDGVTNLDDVSTFVGAVLRSNLGDANLDGLFNASDLTRLFQLGEYNDSVLQNSTWSSGDWNCDQEFDSEDLVAAFRAGGYTISTADAPPFGAAERFAAAIPSDKAVRSVQGDHQRSPAMMTGVSEPIGRADLSDLRLTDQVFADWDTPPVGHDKVQFSKQDPLNDPHFWPRAGHNTLHESKIETKI